ncbi:hypothetical protein NDU88_003280 [Pleurodeles waltl]|uniref:Uncharacterized protein n=1 Tax=Pleurodeles waltl TaxID=8319 RepID=A0AAV7SG13_PLEWA|nr:hypothetical protein NDU88_003280 [Pleurodeles waltl]
MAVAGSCPLLMTFRALVSRIAESDLYQVSAALSLVLRASGGPFLVDTDTWPVPKRAPGVPEGALWGCLPHYGEASADHAFAWEHNGAMHYTYPAPAATDSFGGSGQAVAVLATVEEPSRAELLAAMQGTRVALEGKIEMVAVEVNLL